MTKFTSVPESARAGRLPALLGVAVLSLGLAGCGGGSGGDGGSVSTAIFGNPTNQPTAQPVGPQEDDPTCPSVEVLEGTASLRVGRAGSGDVAHQASLNDVARECLFQPGSVSLKVGVQGRVLIGTAGRPGTYTVPVRVVVKRGESVVVSRIARISVSIPAGEASVPFAHVEEGISVSRTPGRDPADEFSVLVGLDSGGGGRSRARR